jgi:hypothetical protein
LPALTALASNDAVTINTSYPNGVMDADQTNNPTVSFNVLLATQNTHVDVTVQIVTDAYGSETTWDIKNALGTTVLSGGPYSNLSAAGTTTETPVSGTLSTQTCHTFTIYDSYGDGLDAGYGVGSFTVTDGSGSILASGGQFSDSDGAAFKTGNTSTTDINELTSNISIYPNPVKDVLTIEGSYVSIEIVDLFGKVVLSSGTQKVIDVSNLSNGVYLANIKNQKSIIVKKITITK